MDISTGQMDWQRCNFHIDQNSQVFTLVNTTSNLLAGMVNLGIYSPLWPCNWSFVSIIFFTISEETGIFKGVSSPLNKTP